MKSILKVALVVLAFFANNVFAQACIPGPQVYGQGQTCWDGRVIVPNPQLQYNGQQMYANEQAMIAAQVRIQNNGGQHNSQQQQYQVVNRTRACTPDEERRRTAQNITTGAVIGAGAGYLHGGNRNATGKGALIGALLTGGYSEMTACTITETVRVPIGGQQVVQGGNQGWGIQGQQGQQSQNGRICIIEANGKKSIIKVDPSQSCEDLAMLVANSSVAKTETTQVGQQTVASVEKPVVAETLKVNAPFWGYYHPKASPENKMKCFTTKQISGMPPQCSSVEVQPSKDGETETDWRARMAG